MAPPGRDRDREMDLLTAKLEIASENLLAGAAELRRLVADVRAQIEEMPAQIDPGTQKSPEHGDPHPGPSAGG